LPPDLVHLVFVESGFNLHARSVSAAVGPWQFLRSTARLFGLTVNQWVDERRDPEKSTVAAARYLQAPLLHLRRLAAGAGLVQRRRRHRDAARSGPRAPPTTGTCGCLGRRKTTCRSSWRSWRSRGPAEVRFRRRPAGRTDGVRRGGAQGGRGPALDRAPRDCSYEELKQLNPAVLHHATRGTNGVTTLRVPAAGAKC